MGAVKRKQTLCVLTVKTPTLPSCRHPGHFGECNLRYTETVFHSYFSEIMKLSLHSVTIFFFSVLIEV